MQLKVILIKNDPSSRRTKKDKFPEVKAGHRLTKPSQLIKIGIKCI